MLNFTSQFKGPFHINFQLMEIEEGKVEIE
jgi:hypothetical protein